ncbi:hypothetical protein Q361_1721 [Flavobacterium croceum DSM 17960]|uniref:Uncharacterized protein n=1 Tax=Flavobacterium croceum DSM 17960 TaxID=1121886 RepID=A0A2S4N4C7_9FLAO|nr:hypothetical protein [Flavobacterium croceum]POS00535.1 hypothetical protein Q361_1721 [Flavobacterium croceum DSM 17960]
MDEKINEEYLLVLKKNSENLIFVDYENIVNPILSEQIEFNSFFSKSSSTLKELISLIDDSKYLEKLYFFHKYCVSLIGTYQQKLFSKTEIIKQIKTHIDLFELKSRNEENFNEYEAVSEYLQEIKNEFEIRFKSYAINISYKKCIEDINIISFSHRSAGWSNPIYNLNENFSIEIKTNFGFGNSSYFYTIIKYKNIEITPFSDWINYEHAKFSEIVRYTRIYTRYIKHLKYNSYKPNIENYYWEDAMTFAKDACNLSITDESKFIEKYILDECEEMVYGLENIFLKDKFNFIDRETNGHYEVNKKGHYLMEFRGEKISGSLEFVNKILAFRDITKVDIFITRLENCNKKIQPYLLKEIETIKDELNVLQKEFEPLKPIYKELSIKDENYNNEFLKIKREIIKNCREKGIEFDEILYFYKKNTSFPEYEEFHEEFKIISEKYNKLNQTISNLNLVFSKIKEYETNIQKYFSKEK